MGRPSKEIGDLTTTRPGSPNRYCNFTVDGRRFRGSLETDDREEAERRAFHIREQALSGAAQDKKTAITLSEAFGSYWLQVGQHRASSDDIARMSKTITAALGKSTLLTELTMRRLADYVAKRRGTKARYKDSFLSPRSINAELIHLRATLIHARDVLEVPVPKIEWKKLFLEEPDEREIVLSPKQQNDLRKALRPDYWPLVSFALESGQRLANCRELRWSQIDWDRKLIILQLKSRKPGGRTHAVPLTREMIKIITPERGRHPEFVFTYICQRNRRVSIQPTATCARTRVEQEKGVRYPFTENGFRKDWRAALEACGLDAVRFHDLRHTRATRVQRASGNIKIVQKLLGHRDIKSTLRYLRADIDDVREAMEKTQSQTQNPARTSQPVKKKRKSAT